jgi:hypothetical protein
MNKKDALFVLSNVFTSKKRKMKVIPPQKWLSCEYDENFIYAISGLKRIYFFKKKRRLGQVRYCIECNPVEDVSLEDINYIADYFSELGWEVYEDQYDSKPINGFALPKSYSVLYITGRKE